MSGIEYFYSAHSAFAYLGSRRLIEIVEATGCELTHKPYDLSVGIKGAGSSSTRERPQKYKDYFFRREIDRWAEFRNASIVQGYPTYHWSDITIANCVLIAGTVAGQEVNSLAHAMLEGHWSEDLDLSNHHVLKTLMQDSGFDPEHLLKLAQTSEVYEIYENNTKEAIDRSVFGSPTYFVDGDMFYGQDRLEMVERAISKPFNPSTYTSIDG